MTASPHSGFCQAKAKMESTGQSTGDFKDFGPLVGAIDQGTSSSRFLVSLYITLKIGASPCRFHFSALNAFSRSTGFRCLVIYLL